MVIARWKVGEVRLKEVVGVGEERDISRLLLIATTNDLRTMIESIR